MDIMGRIQLYEEKTRTKEGMENILELFMKTVKKIFGYQLITAGSIFIIQRKINFIRSI